MKTKAELLQPPIVRVSVNLGNTNEEQTELDPQGGGRGGRIRWGGSRAARSRVFRG